MSRVSGALGMAGEGRVWNRRKEDAAIWEEVVTRETCVCHVDREIRYLDNLPVDGICDKINVPIPYRTWQTP